MTYSNFRKILPHTITSLTLAVCCVANGNACIGIMSDYVFQFSIKIAIDTFNVLLNIRVDRFGHGLAGSNRVVRTFFEIRKIIKILFYRILQITWNTRFPIVTHYISHLIYFAARFTRAFIILTVILAPLILLSRKLISFFTQRL